MPHRSHSNDIQYRIISIVLCFLFLSPAFGISAETRIGTVDMAVLTALHPLMAQFDFEKQAFLVIPFNLSRSERESFCIRLREESKAREPLLRETLARIASEDAALERKRAGLIGSIRQSAVPAERASLDLALRNLAEHQQSLRALREETAWKLEYPEYSSASETKSIFNTIDSEVLAAIDDIASRSGVNAVLNSSLPFPPYDPSTKSFSPALENRLTWLETDLYYAFLASTTPESVSLAPSATENPADEWVKLIRHPAAAPFFPVRPYPLVLRGGIDLTGDVLAKLLERYHVDASRASILIEAVQTFRKR